MCLVTEKTSGIGAMTALALCSKRLQRRMEVKLSTSSQTQVTLKLALAQLPRCVPFRGESMFLYAPQARRCRVDPLK